MIPTCGRCGEPKRHGEVWAGVRVNAARSEEGHYACVVAALGPELAGRAMSRGLLPRIDSDQFVGRVIRKWYAPPPEPPEDL